MIKLNRKDLKILSLLDMNARMSLPQLAKKVGISRQLLEYRINRLRNEGVIVCSVAVYDQKVAGTNIYRVLLQLYNIDDKEIKEFIEYLKKNYRIMWLARIGNGWDLIINIMATDTYEFDNIFMSIMENHDKIIQNYIILTYVNIRDLPRNYISEIKSNTMFFHEMSDKRIELDQKDRKIVELLGKDCLQSNIQIGKQVGLTGNAVKYRVKNYIENKFLLGFRTIINPNKLGYQNFLTFLIINNLKTSDEKRLLEYFKNHKNITFVVKHIGQFRIGLEIEARNVEHLEQIIRELRTNFKELINDVRIFPVLEEYIFNYVP